jgi:hypothetical protein
LVAVYRSATHRYQRFSTSSPDTAETMQKLHLVMGGRVSDPQTLEFQDLSKIDLVGIYPDYASAEEAWRGCAQRTVDDAEMRYVVVHLHKLLTPGED